MKLIHNVEDIDRNQWQSLVNLSPVSSIFQTPEMVDFYINSGIYQVDVVAVTEGGRLTGVIVCQILFEGIFVKKRLSTRGIINGGPLIDKCITPEALYLLLNSLISLLKQKCIYIEIRNLNDYSPWKEVFSKAGFDYVPHFNFHLDTTSADRVMKRMDTNRRRAIRRATENQVSISTDISLLPDFYQILSSLYKNKVRKPLPPFSFFSKLKDLDFAKYLFIKNVDGKTIGGHLILTLNNKVVYSWYCCGLDKIHRHSYPSVMATYAAIQYAVDNHFAYFDMMGAGEPGKDYGVRDFKSQFGGELVEHGRFLYLCFPLIYKAGKLAINIMAR